MATKYKRGKTWWARAQRGGREYRESLKTRNSGVAEKRLKQWVEDLEAADWGDRPRVTFREAMKQFTETHLPTLKPGAAKRYGVSLIWLNERMGDKLIGEIGRADLADFEGWRRNMEARNGDGRKVSGPTVRRDLACLSSMLAFSEDRDWLGEGTNPVPGYLRRRARRGLKEAPQRTRYLTGQEETDLLAKASPGVREAIMLAIDTGLREQEQFGLTWPQVDLVKGIIATTADTKSKRIRTVPLPARSAQFLAQWKARNATSEDGKVSYPFVFRHEDEPGKRLRSCNKGFKAAARRAEINDLRWHDLRRTAGCRWRQRDEVSLEKVSILLGHSSYAVTEKAYAFLQNESIATDLAAQKPAHNPADKPKKASKTGRK